MRFRDLKIGAKQAIAFGIIAVTLAGANAISLKNLGDLSTDVEEITRSWLPRALTISELNLYVTDLRQSQLQIAVTEDSLTRSRELLQASELIDKIDAAIDNYERLRDEAVTKGLYSERERASYQQFGDSWDQYLDLSFDFASLVLTGRPGFGVSLLNGEMRTVFERLRDALHEVVRINTEDPYAAAKRAEEAFQRARHATITLLLLTLALAVLLVLVFVKLITKPVKLLSNAAVKVAEGDLDIRIDRVSGDEIGRLAHSFNRMTSSLRDARAKTVQQEEALRRQNLDLEMTLKQLQETQQQLVMREKMASLGQLVAGVAHEINNPVGAVNSAADNTRRAITLLRERAARLPEAQTLLNDPQIHKALGALDENTAITTMASERISRIVRSLKSFARLDESDFQKAHVHDCLDTTLTLLHHELKNRIEVVRNYGDLPEILCFPNELNQVFMNLFVNAVQAIRDKGQIVVSTSRDRDSIYIKITDSGSGIQPQHLPRIFDPGFTTKGVGVGTGLGLSISYNIIKKHDGEITVDSQVGRGTTFTIRLPIRL
ncbi:MAG: MCP four helix bundle domain-containing protein [candidate division Zixibacteria bacterium]|nr:MCP four helix bundle domain-containing protein [candidate division Zixibacteria bacterium]